MDNYLGQKQNSRMGVSRDKSDHVKLENRLRELAAIVDNFDDAIISSTLEGIVVSWNEAAERIYGYSAQEAIGHSASMLIPLGREHEMPEILQRIRRCEWTKNMVTTRRRKDGALVDVLLTVSPISHFMGQDTGVLVIARDITLRKRLEEKLLEIGVDERRRLGHDLHDGLGQFLLGIALKTKMLEEALTRGKSQEAWRAKEVVGLVNTAIVQTRNLAHGLDPIHVEANGLVAALRNLATQTRELFQVECTFICKLEHLDVNAQTGIAFYRIAQEAIQNAIRHGQARQINVELALDGMQLCLKILDDGKGFSPDSECRSGMGLQIMQFRANSISGHLIVESQPNKGTRIECTVPAKLWSAKKSAT
jgi:PAS domain S-box-containing protein